jgi:hypothetical protein
MNSNLIGNILTALVLYLLGNKLLEGLGIKDTKEEKEAEKKFSAASGFKPFEILFTPDFIFDVFKNLPQDKKDQLWNEFSPKDYQYYSYCTQILGSKNLLNDDENAVYSVFKAIKSLEELAWFTWKWKEYVQNNPTEMALYYGEFGSEIDVLGMFLNSFLNASELYELETILKPLKSKFK